MRPVSKPPPSAGGPPVAREPATGLVRLTQAAVPLAVAANCRVVAFRSEGDGMDHVAVLVGEPERVAAPLVHFHIECFVHDLCRALASVSGDAPGIDPARALARMAEDGAGILLHLTQPRRGAAWPDWGSRPADRGDVAAAMLRLLGLTRVRLLADMPVGATTLARGGVDVVSLAAKNPVLCG